MYLKCLETHSFSNVKVGETNNSPQQEEPIDLDTSIAEEPIQIDPDEFRSNNSSVEYTRVVDFNYQPKFGEASKFVEV